MSHDYHERLPGFHPHQILVDGCHECESRSKRNDRGISSLDRELFEAAWRRARQWQREGLVTISDAELPLLDTLASVQAAIDRAGSDDGYVVSAAAAEAAAGRLGRGLRYPTPQ